MSEAYNVAQTIMDQMRAFGTIQMMSWGFRSPVVSPEETLDDIGYHYGGLVFMVSGLLYTGKVQVLLCGNDTYTVRFGTHTRKNGFKPKKGMKVYSGIYFDELVSTIDSVVENESGELYYKTA